MVRGPCEHDFSIQTTIPAKINLPGTTIVVTILDVPALKCSRCPKKEYKQDVAEVIFLKACKEYVAMKEGKN